MTALTRPRGPLPKRVYWTRRLLLVALVLGLVYGVAHVLQLSSGPDGRGSATTVGAVAAGVSSSAARTSPSADPSSATLSQSPTPTEADRPGRGRSTRPADPQGVCADSDVVVTPDVKGAHVGQPIQIVLEVTTQEAEACTWQVDSDSVVLKVTDDGGDTVWTTQQCPSAVPAVQVVPRRTLPDTVVVSWSGQGSDATCSASPEWARPGSYRAVAVARGSVTPVETTFDLKHPVQRTVTASPTPSEEPTSSESPTH